MSKTVAIVGALDTKGPDIAFVKEQIERRGHRAFVIDVGVMAEPGLTPEVTATEVARAGGAELAELRAEGDKARAMEAMTRGAAVVVKELFDQGEIHGILGLGGSAGTVIGTAAMRAVGLHVPKVMVSTVAAGDVAAYVGASDIVMIPSVVDVAGLNRISQPIYANAVGAMVGMLETEYPALHAMRPLIAASMFGNTTQAVSRCQTLLDQHGYETLVFHATGSGGRCMEQLIVQGWFQGVLDITTTEWADELAGGVFSAGPHRLEAAAAAGVPQVIVPGCVDMVNFWAPETVPAKYQGRLLYPWNPNVTLMRTTADENRQIGCILAEKANASTGPVAFLLPLRGVSMLDSPGGEFWDPEADAALFEAIREQARAGIEVIELDHNINDDAFADAAAQKLLDLMGDRVG
jgi:uncharacterized protein (UPF0261 family)